ncbi:hypothetical protein [Curvivirga sp.]|uniref:hypothetical protein n=1 Tax=Curvivirga sp. TaxID=2856848 RepID=UPI003B5C0D9F
MSTIIDRLNSLDLEEVLKAAIAAAKVSAGGEWNEIREFAKKAAKNLLNSGVMVAKLLAENSITEGDARQLAEEEKIVVRMQLRTFAGVALVTAQNVFNAVMGVVKETINGVIGLANPIF